MTAPDNQPNHRIHVDLDIDLDRHLAGAARYDRDGEPIGSGPQTLEGVVIDAVVAQVVASVLHDHDYGCGVRDRIGKLRDEVIREQITPLVTEAIEAAVQPTNNYGEPTGTPVSLRAAIVSDATKYLRTKTRDGGYNTPESTPIQRFIREEVAKAIKADLGKALEEARAEVQVAVQAEAATLLAETIKRAAVRL